VSSRAWLRPASAALALCVGCSADAGQMGSGARLAVQWSGSEASSFHAPASAEWCDSLNLLEILAMSGDTGIGIAIYPREGIASGSYPVRPPPEADSVPPSSAIGLRWFSQSSVRGFQSDSGNLALTLGSDGTLSGRFNAAAHAVSGKGAIRLTGSFDGLRQRPATRGCSTAAAPPTPPPARPDSGARVD
jgi:hypothetical protein